MFNNFSVSDCGPSSLLVRYHAKVGRSNRLETKASPRRQCNTGRM